jgi:hypothetical protein
VPGALFEYGVGGYQKAAHPVVAVLVFLRYGAAFEDARLDFTENLVQGVPSRDTINLLHMAVDVSGSRRRSRGGLRDLFHRQVHHTFHHVFDLRGVRTSAGCWCTRDRVVGISRCGWHVLVTPCFRPVPIVAARMSSSDRFYWGKPKPGAGSANFFEEICRRASWP